MAIARQRTAAHWWIENREGLWSANEVAARMITEDYGITHDEARKDAVRANEWVAKIQAA